MRKRTTYYAGAVVWTVETAEKKTDGQKKRRAAKSRETCEAVKRRNRIRSRHWLELLLAVNFPAPGSGNVLTLTFEDGKLPKNRAQARRKLDHFLNKRLREACEAAGIPRPRAIWAIEVLSSAHNRWHVHMVIDSAVPLDMIRKCWSCYGSNIECRKLRVDGEKDHATLAAYFSKELREAQEWEAKPGQHVWGKTQNCLAPEIVEELVPERSQLRAPRDAVILIHERRETAFDEIRELKYRLPASRFRRGARPGRRRRR